MLCSVLCTLRPRTLLPLCFCPAMGQVGTAKYLQINQFSFVPCPTQKIKLCFSSENKHRLRSHPVRFSKAKFKDPGSMNQAPQQANLFSWLNGIPNVAFVPFGVFGVKVAFGIIKRFWGRTNSPSDFTRGVSYTQSYAPEGRSKNEGAPVIIGNFSLEDSSFGQLMI